MFEREVMITTLKKQSETLKNLVEEIERQPKFSWQETLYYHESLKRIESTLKRIRKMDEDRGENAAKADRMRYVAYPMRIREAW